MYGETTASRPSNPTTNQDFQAFFGEVVCTGTDPGADVATFDCSVFIYIVLGVSWLARPRFPESRRRGEVGRSYAGEKSPYRRREESCWRSAAAACNAFGQGRPSSR